MAGRAPAAAEVGLDAACIGAGSGGAERTCLDVTHGSWYEHCCCELALAHLKEKGRVSDGTGWRRTQLTWQHGESELTEHQY